MVSAISYNGSQNGRDFADNANKLSVLIGRMECLLISIHLASLIATGRGIILDVDKHTAFFW